MKKYTKPVAEIEIFESTDVITISTAGTQGVDEAIESGFTATGLGFSKHSS